MFNQAKKNTDDLYQFDPASYVDMARKIIAEHERTHINSHSGSTSYSKLDLPDTKELYWRFHINRIF